MNLLPKIMWKKGSRRTGGLERRLHRRALLYWHSIGRGRDFPSVADFDPLALEDRSAHGFMVDVTNSAMPMLTHVGLVLRDEASVKSVPIALADVAPDTLLGQFAGRWNEVLDSRRPVEAEYVFVTEAGYRVFCRGVLLPLSSSVSEIDHIYGVISWKSEKLFAND